MNPGRFFLPNMANQFGPVVRASYSPSRGIGFFSRMINSIRRFNWNGILNGANKTLNVVNQTIPLVRQAGPMVNNMKNMFRLAKAFGNETTTKKLQNNVVRDLKNHKDINAQNDSAILKKEVMNDNYPNFFI